MPSTIELDDVSFQAALKGSQQLGVTPEAYVRSLINAATQSFDDILRPARDAFKRGQFSEDELDAAVDEARGKPGETDPGSKP